MLGLAAGSSRAGAPREGSVSWGPAKRGERQAGRKVASLAWAGESRVLGRKVRAGEERGPGRRCALRGFLPSRW